MNSCHFVFRAISTILVFPLTSTNETMSAAKGYSYAQGRGQLHVMPLPLAIPGPRILHDGKQWPWKKFFIRWLSEEFKHNRWKGQSNIGQYHLLILCLQILCLPKSRRPRTQNLENSHDCKVKRCPPEYVTHEKHKKAANIKCNRKCSVQNKFGTIKMCWAMSMKFAFCSKNAKFWG